ncbi:MAG: hypothetical protein ACD_9C00344G0002 [uncultured bacterium]|nr:MAG: hypothetical protein ACD_9C00344G0002 [uncultured bacterium]
MNKKIIILVVGLIFVVTGLIVAIYLKKSVPSPVIDVKKENIQEAQIKTETVKETNVEVQKITNELNLINDEDFGEVSLSDSNMGL